MAYSQNGWGVVTDVSKQTVSLPYITGRVRSGDVYVVFEYLAERFNAEVEKIEKWQSWGGAFRNVRGSSSTISNHASFTAVDFNAVKHVLGRVGTFTMAKVKKLRRILADLTRMAGAVAVRWGGDYKGRKDEMHFELLGSASVIRRLADAIRNGAKAVADKAAQAAEAAKNKALRVGGKTIAGFKELYALEQEFKASWARPSHPDKARLAAATAKKRGAISLEQANRIWFTIKGDLAWIKARHPDWTPTIRSYEALLSYAAWLVARKRAGNRA